MDYVRAADAWVARTMFHPPITLVCWVLGWTPVQLSRWLWALFFFAASYGAWRAGSWFWLTIDLIFLMLFSLRAAYMDPQLKLERSSLFLRLLFWTITPLDVFLLTEGELAPLLQTSIILFAEYATTLHTLPPAPWNLGVRAGQES